MFLSPNPSPIPPEAVARRVNVGCGLFPIPYWTNLDADPNMPAQITATVPPMPFPDGSLDEVMASHMLEHLTRQEATVFAAEVFRVLRPGGIVAIIVPDFAQIVRDYLADRHEAVELQADRWWLLDDLDDICEGFIYSTIQPSQHRWMYDKHTLGRLLKHAGFDQLKLIDPLRDERIINPTIYQVGIEGRKPQ